MSYGQAIPKNRHVKLAFHGTDYDYDGEVLPPSMHGGNQHFRGLSEVDLTYFIPAENVDADRERDAWRWANTGWSSDKTGRTRFRVHVTRPVGKQYFDGNLHHNSMPYGEDDWISWARVSERQVIVDTIWAPPPDFGHTMVEATLPKIDWKEYGGEWFIVHGIGEFGSWKVANRINAEAGDDDIYYNRKYPCTDVVPVRPQPVPEGQLVLDVGDGGYVPPPPEPEQPIVRFLGGGDYIEPYEQSYGFLERYGYGSNVMPVLGSCKPFDYGMAKRQTSNVGLDWLDNFYETKCKPTLDWVWPDEVESDP